MYMQYIYPLHTASTGVAESRIIFVWAHGSAKKTFFSLWAGSTHCTQFIQYNNYRQNGQNIQNMCKGYKESAFKYSQRIVRAHIS
jgi:hypothetical protein